MDPLVEFLEFAIKGEGTTPGGWINLCAVAIGVIVVSGSESGNLLMQGWEFAYRVLDRMLHAIDKFCEFIAALAGATYHADLKPEAYRAPREESKLTASLIVLVFFAIACILSVGGARYNAPSKTKHPDRHGRIATSSGLVRMARVPADASRLFM
jgi:hypothetical protein